MKNDFDFEAALRRLEEIGELMSAEDTTLDRTVELYREAAELAKGLEARLREAQTEIIEITKAYEDENEL